ncbi:MAG: saccharopine dehydrogenase C-terminal domain-containing protein [Pseudomonadales bacterium]|nr:homospermidine synthase [Pseudomonadales bacterium]
MALHWPKYAAIDGPILLIGFGSIGRGVLPLLERHFEFDAERLWVIDPDSMHRPFLEQRNIKLLAEPLTAENFKAILRQIFSGAKGQGFVVNVSIETDSLDIMKYCRELGVFYIDTVVEPWPGLYFDATRPLEERTNYALRERVRREKTVNPGGTTAISCCGANPGMVSWFVKSALVELARDLGHEFARPVSRRDWAELMRDLGVKGVHIAERDTQVARQPKPVGTFVNTWSVDGFLSESLQPAELGWGTHEKWFPENARRHQAGCQAAIYLTSPGGGIRVRSWCPTSGPQFGFLVTHNEAISIADYFTLGDPGAPDFRPTCHYAYHPCNDAVLSLHETFGSGLLQTRQLILDETEVVEGADELGVLLYGHARNAFWYGSKLTIEQTRRLAPYQNATGLQVSSAILAGMVWALENPAAGIVETEEMDHTRCLAVQMQYLGSIERYYTDWHPLTNRWSHFEEQTDDTDPWQFRNVLAS